ncbi:MAG: glycosyltransferase [Opitutaceae bacterium]|nr:glycosyltransferase [Opitutaceae bacterium]
MPPLVSRIVTCYRQWAYLAQWIGDETLFSPEIEWFVVNDAPADPPPPELAAKLTERGIRLLSPPANLGRSRARNLGARESSGRWLDFIDGDDRPLVLATTGLAESTAGLIEHPVRLAQKGRDLFELGASAPVSRPSIWRSLLPEYQPINVTPAAVLWRRETFQLLAGFDARFDGAEDFHLVFRAMLAEVPLARLDTPKQCYFSAAHSPTKDATHIDSHQRVLSWIVAQDLGALSEEARFWLGKEVVYDACLKLRVVWTHRRSVWRFLRSRLGRSNRNW